jgi:hypothetical protein
MRSDSHPSVCLTKRRYTACYSACRRGVSSQVGSLLPLRPAFRGPTSRVPAHRFRHTMVSFEWLGLALAAALLGGLRGWLFGYVARKFTGGEHQNQFGSLNRIVTTLQSTTTVLIGSVCIFISYDRIEPPRSWWWFLVITICAGGCFTVYSELGRRAQIRLKPAPFQALTRLGGLCSAALLYVVGFENPSWHKLIGVVLSAASLAVLSVTSRRSRAVTGSGSSPSSTENTLEHLPIGVLWTLGCVACFGAIQVLNTAAAHAHVGITPIVFATGSNAVVVLTEFVISLVSRSSSQSPSFRPRQPGELRKPFLVAMCAGCLLGVANFLGAVCLLTALERASYNASAIIAVAGTSAYVVIALHAIQSRLGARSGQKTSAEHAGTNFIRRHGRVFVLAASILLAAAAAFFFILGSR